jgi:hypothetical protein
MRAIADAMSVGRRYTRNGSAGAACRKIVMKTSVTASAGAPSMKARHDGVLQEAAFQDDGLPAAHAPLSQPAPLAGRVHARLVRHAIPGMARAPGGPRASCPQLVHGPGPDRVILIEFAERPRVFPPARQPILDPLGCGRLARADHSLDQDQPRCAHRPKAIPRQGPDHPADPRVMRARDGRQPRLKNRAERRFLAPIVRCGCSRFVMVGPWECRRTESLAFWA